VQVTFIVGNVTDNHLRTEILFDILKKLAKCSIATESVNRRNVGSFDEGLGLWKESLNHRNRCWV
jgi:hypothetical protein